MSKTPPGVYIDYGTWVERGVIDQARNFGDPVDVVRVPAFGDDWYYELTPGMSDRDIVQAVKFYQFGFSKGMDSGAEKAKAEIRKALGIAG